MAILSMQDRRYTWSQALRDGVIPTHWNKNQVLAAVNTIDDNLDTLIDAIASTLSVSSTVVVNQMLDYSGIFSMMTVASFRTNMESIKLAAEVAAGEPFIAPGESGLLGSLLSNKRFAKLVEVILKRRTGNYPTEKE